MELVYLWVEKYKNIKNQGFNFSPRFECEFKDGNLTICDKKEKECEDNEYLENFFGENINITAIVGENGTGKSRLLCNILDNINEHNISDDRVQPFIQCYFDKNNKKLIIESYSLITDKKQINSPSLNCELISVSDTGIIENSNFRDKMFFYHYKNDLDYPINYNKYGTYNEKIIKFTELNKPNNIINLEIEEEKNLKKLLFLIDSTNYSINENRFFVPDKVWLQKENIRFLGKDKTIESKYKNIKKSFISDKKIKELLLLENILFIINLHKENSYEDVFQNISLPQFNINATNITQEIDTFKTNFLSLNFQSEIDKSRNNIKDNHNRDNYQESLIINECEKFLKLFENIDYFMQILKNDCTDDTYYPKNELLNGNETNIKMIQDLPRFIKIELIDSRTGVEYSELSTGEKSLLDVVYSIKNIIELRIKNNLSNNIFILLDEIESYLHPNWQKNLISYIYNFIKIYKINIHIILTSHSPFILSDIPKENVIFLKKYDENNNEVKSGNQKVGNCRNATKDVELKTFGANIHTLLSNGFFMSDGLMGEFAKNKINEIIAFLNNDKSIDEISTRENQIIQVINNIGEDLIRMKLMDMYYQKYIDDELEKEKQKLLKQKNTIDKQIEAIEKKQNDTNNN